MRLLLVLKSAMLGEEVDEAMPPCAPSPPGGSLAPWRAARSEAVASVQ